jgi:hypothetical protein
MKYENKNKAKTNPISAYRLAPNPVLSLSALSIAELSKDLVGGFVL